MNKIMIVDPGFDYSTLAVAEGYYHAFTRLGYEVVEYNMIKAMTVIKNGLLKITDKIIFNQLTEFACSPIVNQVINDEIDLVLVVHGIFMNESVVIALRRAGVKVGLILTDDPMQVDVSSRYSRFYDYVFTNDRNTANRHKNCHFLPMAVNEKIFFPRDVEEKYRSELLVAGSFYKERIEFLEKYKSLFLKKRTIFVGAKKGKFNDERLEKLCLENKISYETMALYTAGTFLSIDIPRNEFAPNFLGEANKSRVKASCLSPRIFECAASKTVFVTSEDRSDLFEFFPRDLLYIFDNNPKRTIRMALKDKDRKKKTEDLYDICMRDHTYMNRAKKIEEIVSNKRGKIVSNVQCNRIFNVWGKKWNHNFEQMQKEGLYKPERNIMILRGLRGGEKAVIISNGPSLEDERDFSKGFTILLNETIRFMDGDAVCVIHGGEDLYDRCFKNISKEKVKNHKLLASTVVCPKVISLWNENDSEIFFFNTSDKNIRKEIAEQTSYPVLGAGLTVGYSAIACAVYMGFKEIEIYGLDFCFLKGQKYAFHKEFPDDVSRSHGYMIMKDSANRIVLTTSVMVDSRNSVLQLMKITSDVQFIVHGGGILYQEELSNLRLAP
jgi:spore maturation protein CgeB